MGAVFTSQNLTFVDYDHKDGPALKGLMKTLHWAAALKHCADWDHHCTTCQSQVSHVRESQSASDIAGTLKYTEIDDYGLLGDGKSPF